ncbi:hypothetical protein ERX46_11640 [Brumimicrobium glaciale]|uniref:WG repeat-containing protein n=1 Tax=Brumimicrobium glaciale TaxID=200475 RepID=A0A4Q4KJY5_9FLAO|nr:hypothetical protein [Brumimicrobium glaciale]RYM33582.1 hypothetical protein ERX46_11640 [Brumimicrobium glaciale]
MRIILAILLLTFQFSASGQADTLINQQENNRIIQLPDCAHGHICCQVGCYCCPGSIRIDQVPPPLDSRTAYPQNDSLTYNQYVGENIAGFHLANGWRRDTFNGGFNKEIYTNPYIESTRFDKHLSSNIKAFRYENGKLYTGRIEDTILVSFTPDKIRGYLSGQPYYESKQLTVILRGDCVNGMMQGRGILAAQLVGFGMYNNLKLAECSFEDGEIVGMVKNWDLNSVEIEIRNKKVYSRESTKDYFEFTKLLELTEVTYAKGSSIWIERTVHERNEKTGKIKVRTVKN